MRKKRERTTSPESMSCAGDHLASQRAWQESVLAALTSDGCGTKPLGSLASFILATSFSKTRPGSSPSTTDSLSPRSFERLPRSGMLSHGIVCELPTLWRLIGGKGSSSLVWPTPDGGLFNDGQTVEAWKARHERELAKKYNGNGGGTPLAMAVRLSEAGGRLSPAWTETLMGFPVNWTLATEDVGKHPGWPAPPGQAQHSYEPPRTIPAESQTRAGLQISGCTPSVQTTPVADIGLHPVDIDYPRNSTSQVEKKRGFNLGSRAARLKALGNAVVPQCATLIGNLIVALEQPVTPHDTTLENVDLVP
jgi:hypothetical protein